MNRAENDATCTDSCAPTSVAKFEIRGIAPGDYKLLALDGEIDTDAIYDADFMKPFLALSKALSIKVNSQGKYQLSVIGISDEVDLRAQ
jgi:hypothetical protein